MTSQIPAHQQPQQRPEWLPQGHIFCPGPREALKRRIHADMPGFFTEIYTCEHGEWLNLAEAWSDHELSMPELKPNSDQSAKLVFGVRYDDPLIVDAEPATNTADAAADVRALSAPPAEPGRVAPTPGEVVKVYENAGLSLGSPELDSETQTP